MKVNGVGRENKKNGTLRGSGNLRWGGKCKNGWDQEVKKKYAGGGGNNKKKRSKNKNNSKSKKQKQKNSN